MHHSSWGFLKKIKIKILEKVKLLKFLFFLACDLLDSALDVPLKERFRRKRPKRARFRNGGLLRKFLSSISSRTCSFHLPLKLSQHYLCLVSDWLVEIAVLQRDSDLGHSSYLFRE